MALIQQGMVQNAIEAEAFSLEIPEGRSAFVREIHGFRLGGELVDANHIVKVDQRTIFHFLEKSGDHFLFADLDQSVVPTFDLIRRLGLFDGIPLGEGQTLTITAPGTSGFFEVVYDLYDAGDFTGTEKNGRDSNEYQLFQYISNGAAFGVDGYVPLDTGNLTSELPSFPGGEVVPPNTQMKLRAIYGVPVSRGTGAANAWYTQRLRILHERKDIFDLSLRGMMWRGQADFIGAVLVQMAEVTRAKWSDHAGQEELILIDPPIVWTPGQDVDVSMKIVWTSATVQVGDIHIGMLFDVTVG